MNEIRVVLNKIEGTEYQEEFFEAFDFLMSERIKIFRSNVNELIGMDTDKVNVDKEGILKSAKRIDNIAEKIGVSFRFGDDYENIEKMLRLTLLDDIQKDFNTQV